MPVLRTGQAEAICIVLKHYQGLDLKVGLHMRLFKLRLTIIMV